MCQSRDSLQPVEKKMGKQVVPLLPMEVCDGADACPAARRGPHATEGGCALKRWMCPERSCSPWRGHAGAGSCQVLWPVERSPGRSRSSGRTCDPMGGPCWSSPFLKDCTPWKAPVLGAFLQELQPVGRTHVGALCEGLSPLGGTPRWSRGTA